MNDSMEKFRATWEREFASTRKVLDAFPAEQSAFKPHERSSSALQIAQTFVIEQNLTLRALRGEGVAGGGVGNVPETWSDARAAFDAQQQEIMSVLAHLDDASRTVQFFTAGGNLRDYGLLEFLEFMLFDQIHHRGQLTVYVRMAGGKVPAVYGPSADEPWS